MLTADADKALTVALLQIRRHSPFFATLSLFARYRWSDSTRTAATNGKDIFLNPAWFQSRPAAERGGILLHEILHAALEHVPRRGSRDANRWNIAADIVVNGMIDTLRHVALPAGAIRVPALAELSVEAVYERITYREIDLELVLGEDWADLLADVADGGECHGGTTQDARARLTAFWRAALQKAFLAERLACSHYGRLPAGLLREWESLQEPQLDWRTMLWRYLSRTPNDYTGFDRRFVYQGLYLDTLEGESLQVAVCVDTSGSVTAAQLDHFRAEVESIWRAYPHLRVDLYFADTDLIGPWPLERAQALPAPQGGGGTSFVPFFNRLADAAPEAVSLAVYLTDGFGEFPRTRPAVPVLWVITPGGEIRDRIPFGDVVRLADS